MPPCSGATGAPADEIVGLQQASMPVRSFVWAAAPDVLLEDGDKPEVPGWDLSAIWTPGHSPGHLCFWEPSHRLMLSGDHVLPRITPNISFHPQAGPNPLGDFLDPVGQGGRLRRRGGAPRPRVPLPRPPGAGGAAESPSPGPLRRGDRGHRRGGDDGVGHRRSRFTWSCPWDDIQGFVRRAAVGETLAHLHALQVRGCSAKSSASPPNGRS